MSSNYNHWGTPATLAVDGNRDPYQPRGYCAYVRADVWEDLYWQVDLGSLYVIYNLTVYGTDGSVLDGKIFIFEMKLC